MHFKPLSISDIEQIAPFFSSLKSRTCDYTVGGMFMWRDFYHIEFAISNGTFFSRLFDEDQKPHYNIPIGSDIVAGINEIIKFEKQFCPVVKFCTVPEEYIDCFNSAKLLNETVEQDMYFDYLYSAKDLIELRGKKFSGQRNQISQFKRSNENWSFINISDIDIKEVISFFSSSYHIAEDASEYETEENAKVLEVLNNLKKYNMFGGVLYSGEKIVGFSLGEIQNDTLYTHIEKADRNCKGAYQMLVNQFSTRFASGKVEYINREEDMGDTGLRISKQSYHPISRLKKYSVEVR